MKIIKGLVYTDKQYIEILKTRINKAIEYIKDNVAVYSFGNKSEDYAHWEFDDNNIQELLKILKGERDE